MFRLKKDIDFKILEKLGFYLEGNTYKRDVENNKCVSICVLNNQIILPPDITREVVETIEELDLNLLLEWKDMMDAEMAYFSTKFNINSKKKEVLEDIMAEIDKAVAACQFELLYKCDYYNNIESSIIDELRRLGFKVKILGGEIDDYGEYYPQYLKISWKNVNNNERDVNIFNKIKNFLRRK